MICKKNNCENQKGRNAEEMIAPEVCNATELEEMNIADLTIYFPDPLNLLLFS